MLDLNLADFASAMRRPSEQQDMEKSARQKGGNDKVNNRNLDRGKDPVARSSQ
jgi:hypothetical protein